MDELSDKCLLYADNQVNLALLACELQKMVTGCPVTGVRVLAARMAGRNCLIYGGRYGSFPLFYRFDRRRFPEIMNRNKQQLLLLANVILSLFLITPKKKSAPFCRDCERSLKCSYIRDNLLYKWFPIANRVNDSHDEKDQGSSQESTS
ncbi:hypothetical protein EVAR_48369_1 [Eumeta japonica]|uniref:Uncharacterized protein n=1 Tax=Eumeta variegata TaxID=151549 RepID=A0A4C1WIJ3_EUMVA|nr:hypothetical protein EVAR_48369_1 [Eumeta japonica]